MRSTFTPVVTLCSLLTLSSCLPVMVGGGGAGLVTGAAREKGLNGAWSDSQISLELKTKIYQYDTDAHRRVDVNVQEGEVLLTGSLSTREAIDKVEQLAWEVKGVKKVINEVGVNTDDGLHIKQGISDSVITTRVKSALLFDENIKSINYSIKTVGCIVHVMGIAQNQTELDKVLFLARNVNGVKKVISYVQVKASNG